MATRRRFKADSVSVAAGLSAGALGASQAARGAEAPAAETRRRASGSQRRWRTAFGLNGFMSSEARFGNSFKDPYDACRKGRLAIERARRKLGRAGG